MRQVCNKTITLEITYFENDSLLIKGINWIHHSCHFEVEQDH